jgi:hypothetical protein
MLELRSIKRLDWPRALTTGPIKRSSKQLFEGAVEFGASVDNRVEDGDVSISKQWGCV